MSGTFLGEGCFCPARQGEAAWIRWRPCGVGHVVCAVLSRVPSDPPPGGCVSPPRCSRGSTVTGTICCRTRSTEPESPTRWCPTFPRSVPKVTPRDHNPRSHSEITTQGDFPRSQPEVISQGHTPRSVNKVTTRGRYSRSKSNIP